MNLKEILLAISTCLADLESHSFEAPEVNDDTLEKIAPHIDCLMTSLSENIITIGEFKEALGKHIALLIREDSFHINEG